MHISLPSMLSATNKVIGITGATGFIGSHLCDVMQNAGYTVMVLARKKPATTADSCYRYFDLEKHGNIDAALLNGIDVLIHAAWIYEKRMPVTKSNNLISTKKILIAAREAGVKHVIFFSSMAAHEGSLSFYGQTKLQAETYFDPAKDTVLRPGFVIGNGGLGGRLIDYAKKKKIIPLVNGGNQPLHCIGVQQIGEALLRCIAQNIKGNYLLGEPGMITYKAFFKTTAAYYHRKLRFISLSSGLLRIMIRAAAVFKVQLPVTEENLDGLLSLRQADTENDFGTFNLHKKGLEAMLKEKEESEFR